MEITITQEHLDKGVKLSPVGNPLCLAIAEAIDADKNGLFVYVSMLGLLKIHNLEKEVVFSRQLGPDAQYFMAAWDLDYDIEVPFVVEIIPIVNKSLDKLTS